jgi:hypothetical protein
VAENLSLIKDAGQKDWKALAWIVERDPYSKSEYGTQRGDKGQVTVILNIHRDEVSVDDGTIIDAVAVEEHEEPSLDTPCLESSDDEVSEPETERSKEHWQGDNLRERKTIAEHRHNVLRLKALEENRE